jgi:hypothetical protein
MIADAPNRTSTFQNALAACLPARTIPTAEETLEGWYALADLTALNEQKRLATSQRHGLAITVCAIVALASAAFFWGNPVPQVLCPVAVFFFILYLDRLRRSTDSFRFAALRLAAETLRILLAVRERPALFVRALEEGRRGSHAVRELASMACDAVLETFPDTLVEGVSQHTTRAWKNWLNEQVVYFREARQREQERARWGKRIFSTAFWGVAFIATGLGVWVWLYQPASAAPLFRGLLALAAACGSTGLAVINYVRERKAIDQSFDYAHMCRRFESYPKSKVEAPESDLALVSEAMAEHGRWAVRMAGHFADNPCVTKS